MYFPVVNRSSTVWRSFDDPSIKQFLIQQKIIVGSYIATQMHDIEIMLLPIEKLIKFSNIKLMHRFAFGRLPFSFAECGQQTEKETLTYKRGCF
jgi:hypothetical protein